MDVWEPDEPGHGDRVREAIRVAVLTLAFGVIVGVILFIALPF